MTKTAQAAPKAPAKKAGFSMAAMDGLKAAAGVDPISLERALLDDIEPDPDQPRKEHSAADLDDLAYSIKEKGVLQPIGVRPGVNKKWMLVWGEGRWRASRLAGVLDIPILVAKDGQADFESQVIENQQRSRLSNSDLARAVQLASAAGRKNGEIAKLYRLKDYEISGFRAVEKFPDFLRDILDGSDMRGLYDLYRLTTRAPDGAVKAVGVQKALRLYPGGVTYADAQRIITSLGGKGNNNFTPKGDAEPAAPAKSGDREQPLQRAKDEGAKSTPDEAPAAGKGAADAETQARAVMQALAKPKAEAAAPEIYVATADGEVGRLVLDRRAKTAGCVVVQFESFEEEVKADGLKIVDAK